MSFPLGRVYQAPYGWYVRTNWPTSDWVWSEINYLITFLPSLHSPHVHCWSRDLEASARLGGKAELRRMQSQLIHLTVSISPGKENHWILLSVFTLPRYISAPVCPLISSYTQNTDINTNPFGVVAKHYNFSSSCLDCNKCDSSLTLLSFVSLFLSRPNPMHLETYEHAVFLSGYSVTQDVQDSRSINST